MSVPLILTVEQRLHEIALAYSVFLQQGDLHDAPLARMTFFHAVKKTYIEDPLASEDEQKAILHNLDVWLAEIQQTMNDAMTGANVQRS